MIDCQREKFDIPEHVAYLNCGYMSPLSKRTTEVGLAAARRKSTPWITKPEDFFTESGELRRLFATMVNANETDIAFIPSASYGLAIAARNIDVKPGQKILVLEEQFPSNIYCWMEKCKETGGIVQTVKKPADGNWTQAVLDLIDEVTVIAALPHNHWADGGLLDLERISKKLKKYGAKLVLDVTQSLGAMPLDVQKVKPDFMVVAAYKWMMCPYTIGMMYVAPEYQTGEPLEHNWLNRAGSENFAGLVNYQEKFQPGAMRFDVGERANFSLLPMALSAVTQLLEWGVDNIYQTLSQTTDQLADQAASLGLTALPKAYRAGHFLGLESASGFPSDLLSKLAEEDIYLSIRGNSLRVTPHLYNSEHDFSRLLEALSRHLKG
jgi:selenocysteine lyase/cysteine desulfurase